MEQTTSESNQRFKDHGVGYQLENSQIIRIDSEFTHAEIVKPALKLLHQPLWASAEEEFLKAHEHYRKGNGMEAMNECLKAFESVMKIICKKRKWACSGQTTTSALIQTCIENGLIPQIWESQYNTLRNLLASSVPTGRNKISGHGQGTNLDIA